MFIYTSYIINVYPFILPAVIVRLGSTAYTWSEGDGEVAVVIEKIGSNERVISASLQAEPMTALGKINVTHYLIVIDICKHISLPVTAFANNFAPTPLSLTYSPQVKLIMLKVLEGPTNLISSSLPSSSNSWIWLLIPGQSWSPVLIGGDSERGGGGHWGWQCPGGHRDVLTLPRHWSWSHLRWQLLCQYHYHWWRWSYGPVFQWGLCTECLWGCW